MRRLIFILALALLVCLGIGGCTPRRVGEAMNRADSLMTSAPDSALALLDAIDPATLRTDAARARHAVLLTRARHLAYVPVYDDSLIAIGTDYYATHGTHAEKAEAFYMSSVVNNYHQRYEQPIVDGLRAEKHALATSDHLLLGLIYRTIADGFHQLYDGASSLLYYKKSYESFAKAPENKYTGWALLDISGGCLLGSNFAEAESYALKSKAYAEERGDSLLLLNSIIRLGHISFCNDSVKSTIAYYEEAIRMNESKLSGTDIENLGESYIVVGDTAGINYCKRLLENFDVKLPTFKLMMLERDGRYKEAYELSKTILSYQNSEVGKWFNRNYAAVISNYYELEEQRANLELTDARTQKYLIGCLSLAGLIIFTLVYFYRARLLRQKIDKQILIAQNLQNNLLKLDATKRELSDKITTLEARLSDSSSGSELMKSELSRMQKTLFEKQTLEDITKKQIRTLFSSRFKMIDELCAYYHQIHDLPNQQDKIAAKILGIIKEISSDTVHITSLEKYADQYLNGIMSRFRNDYPNLNDWEYTLFLYNILGFSNRAVCIFQNIKLEKYYNRKSSLKRKIETRTDSDTSEYLEYLE